MNIILLSGGSGKNLWPLSNDVRSKQFIKLFQNADGQYESMIQRIYRQIRAIDPKAEITVATSRSQASTLFNQLGHTIGLSAEPMRRDTFPAVVLACEYLKDVRHVDPKEPVVVCPVDLFTKDSFFHALEEMSEEVCNGPGILLLGTEPTGPSTQYGYILPDTADRISTVRSFKEKPDEADAKAYIKEGALWNAGIFAFRLSYVLDLAHARIEYEDYDDLYNKYAQLTPISFDHAVLENSSAIAVLRSDTRLDDLGTWDALSRATEQQIIGNGIVTPACDNVNIINDMDIPVLAAGVKDVVISASQQGILVSSKDNTEDIRPYVDRINEKVMFAEKSWGNFKVLDVSDGSMTIKLTVHAGKRMSYHSHEHRDEIWAIVSGWGRTIVDGMEQPVQAGDVITMQAGCRHTIIADTTLDVIEIQCGDEITTSDKRKFELE
ncbi:MAG: cupin domain-containing protein [Solobacterium sp.]|jgi:mannose-1-phosphate guanylyltransferase|nr:cupin domain-containing protein [Solobacterium sp.]